MANENFVSENVPGDGSRHANSAVRHGQVGSGQVRSGPTVTSPPSDETDETDAPPRSWTQLH